MLGLEPEAIPRKPEASLNPGSYEIETLIPNYYDATALR